MIFIAAALAGCDRWSKSSSRGSPSDASTDATATIDAAGLPETVVVVLDAGGPGGGKAECSACFAPGQDPIPDLPHQCEDSLKTLGTIYFSRFGSTISISSSKTKARASCTHSQRDPHSLICDWVGTTGKPSITKSPVTFGPRKPPSGAYEKGKRFACKPK